MHNLESLVLTVEPHLFARVTGRRVSLCQSPGSPSLLRGCSSLPAPAPTSCPLPSLIWRLWMALKIDFWGCWIKFSLWSMLMWRQAAAFTLWQHWDFSGLQFGCPEDGNLRQRHWLSDLEGFTWLMLEEGDGHQISLAILSNSTGLGATEKQSKTPLAKQTKGQRFVHLSWKTFLSCNVGVCPEPPTGEHTGNVF